MKRSYLWTLLAAGYLWSAGLVQAQMMGQPGTQNPPAGQSGQMNPQSGAPRGGLAGGESRMDRVFYHKASSDGQFEVELSKLAQTKATSQDVKELANMMVTDHTKANEQLQSIAQKNQIQLATQLPERSEKRLEHFRSLSGTAFDRAYTEALIGEHKKAIATFEHESEKGKDQDAKTFAQNTLPTLRQHLQHAETVMKSLPKHEGKM